MNPVPRGMKTVKSIIETNFQLCGILFGSCGSIQTAKLQRTRRCSTKMERSTEALTSADDDDDDGVAAAADDGFQQSSTNDDRQSPQRS